MGCKQGDLPRDSQSASLTWVMRAWIKHMAVKPERKKRLDLRDAMQKGSELEIPI